MPETRYAKSGDLSIAYQVVGDGPIDLVFIPGFASHVELTWEMPPMAATLHGLSSFGRVILFDKRGTGLSDRTAGLPTLAERMDDIRAVMDAAGSERAAILGLSEGGPTGMLFAATYPERTTALVLWLTAVGPPLEELDEQTRRSINWFDEYLGENWGNGNAMRWLVAGAPDDPATVALLARYERNAATPAAAQAVWRRVHVADARPFLSAVNAPTLVVAHSADPFVPIDAARWTAEHIPGAKLVEIAASGHATWDLSHSPDLEIIEEFLTGTRHAQVSDRVLATVMFTDIVESTKRAAEMGDANWRSVLDRHDRLVEQEVTRFRGGVVKTTGDGVLATFDGPARAVGCAKAIGSALRSLGLEVRAGLHTGEVELRGDDIGGMAVHIASRVAALAGAGEVLVSSTVKDLVVGSGLEFEPRGEHELKGVPDPWRLFAATT